MVQQEPRILETILQQVAATNPQLSDNITRNPDEFLHLLHEDRDDNVALPPSVPQIPLTEEERDAIERASCP